MARGRASKLVGINFGLIDIFPSTVLLNKSRPHKSGQALETGCNIASRFEGGGGGTVSVALVGGYAQGTHGPRCGTLRHVPCVRCDLRRPLPNTRQRFRAPAAPPSAAPPQRPEFTSSCTSATGAETRAVTVWISRTDPLGARVGRGGGGGGGGLGRGPPPPVVSGQKRRRNMASRNAEGSVRPRAKENVSQEDCTAKLWAGSGAWGGGGAPAVVVRHSTPSLCQCPGGHFRRGQDTLHRWA